MKVVFYNFSFILSTCWVVGGSGIINLQSCLLENSCKLERFCGEGNSLKSERFFGGGVVKIMEIQNNHPYAIMVICME